MPCDEMLRHIAFMRCVMFSVLMIFIKQRTFFVNLPILNNVKRLKPLKQKTLTQYDVNSVVISIAVNK